MLKLIRLLFKGLLLITGAMSFTRCSSGYKEKSGKTFYNGEEIKDTNLKVLNKVFAKDLAAAYYRGDVIETADASTFVAINENYAKDKTRVYFCSEQRESQTYFTTKKRNIYILDGADAASFVEVPGGYAKDKSRVYIEGSAFRVKDLKSFRGISLYLSADDIQVYFHGKAVPGSDGKTFSLINNHYAKDSKQVYYYGYPSDLKNEIYVIPCINASFQILDYPYASDGQAVFYENLLIRQANPKGFEKLNAGFSKDSLSVFYKTRKLDNADAASFQVMEQNAMNTQEFYFARDKQTAYFKDKKIKGVDLPSFRIAGLGYALDKNHVYYRETIIKSADAKTFEVYAHGFGEADSKDAHNEFLEGKIVNQ